jgi:hypothetical protein
MDQKPIVLYLPISGSPDLRMKGMKGMKGMTLDAIHDDLVSRLGKDAVAYSTVTKYALSAHFSDRNEATAPNPELQMWNAVLSMR